MVIAAEGYPGKLRAGDLITGAEHPGVIRAGTRGRAYALTATLHLPGGLYRSDIALRVVRGELG